jgi:hypothetical protein
MYFTHFTPLFVLEKERWPIWHLVNALQLPSETPRGTPPHQSSTVRVPVLLFLFGDIAAVLRGEAPAGPAGPALLRGLLRADTLQYFSRMLRVGPRNSHDISTMSPT